MLVPDMKSNFPDVQCRGVGWVWVVRCLRRFALLGLKIRQARACLAAHGQGYAGGQMAHDGQTQPATQRNRALKDTRSAPFHQRCPVETRVGISFLC